MCLKRGPKETSPKRGLWEAYERSMRGPRGAQRRSKRGPGEAQRQWNAY